MSGVKRNGSIESLFGPSEPRLPKDQHVLRRLHDQVDEMIHELRRAMANAADAK